MNNSPPAPLVHISLFSGIGGFELAAAQIGWKNAASCEINDFGHTVLQYHFPNSYHHRDVKTLTYQILNEELTKRFGPNWRSNGIILSGGFPCQGFSVAGLMAGTDDDRYLWPEYLRLIDEINPDWICGENVTGILTMEDKSGIYRDVFAKMENRKITRFHQIDYYEAVYTRQSKMLVNSICESLEERGFEVQPFAIPAASVEAPHKRERIWFVANRCRNGSYGTQNGQGDNKGNDRNETRKITIEQPAGCRESAEGKIGTISSDTNINDAGGYRYGQTPRIGKVIKEERQRVRCIIERISDKESITDADEINWRSKPQGRSKTPRPWRQLKGRISASVADGVGNRGGKSMGGKQSELPNQYGKEKGINAYTSGTRRQELDIPGVAATPGHGYRVDNGGNGGNGGRFENFPTQSPVCGGNDGLPTGLDNITFSKWRNESIKGFGNAVVPHLVFEIFSAIEKYRIFETT